MNKDWTEKLIRTPDPNKTLGLKFMRNFIDSRYGAMCKTWVKAIDKITGKLIYKFDSIYYTRR